MSARRRGKRIEPTHEWQELLPLFRWPEQEEYERIRRPVLFGDIWEARAGPRTRSSAAASAAATLVHSDGKEPSQKMTMLIPVVEKLGPATIGVIGTLITSSLSLYFTRTIP